MSQSRLQTDDLTTDIDLAEGVWRHEYASVAIPGSEDDALNKLQSGGVIQAVFPLVSTDESLFVASSEAIQTALELARNWKTNPLFYNALWWKVQLYGQTSKRFLVVGGNFTELTGMAGDPFYESNVRRANLVLYLHVAPAENNLPRTEGALSTYVPGVGGGYFPAMATPTYADESEVGGLAISALGGTLQLAGKGTRPGRIALLEVINNNAADLGEIWLGLKSTRAEAGAASTFDPSLTDVTGVSGTPYTFSSGGAGENTYGQQTVTHNSGAWGSCSYVSVLGGGGTASHMIGTYLMLLRYQVSAVSTANVTIRVRSRYTTNSAFDTTFITQSPVYKTVDTMANWGLLPLGILRYPHLGSRQDILTRSVYIQLQANMITTGDTATMRWNRILLVPIPYIYVSGASLGQGAADRTVFLTHPDDRQECFTLNGYGVEYEPTVEIQPNFYLPVEGAVLSIVAARSLTNQNSADTVDAGMVIYDRYMSHKGDG